mgnify:CR=1 FL=1
MSRCFNGSQNISDSFDDFRYLRGIGLHTNGKLENDLLLVGSITADVCGDMVKRLKCPKCQSGNVYGQEGELVCMMCGKRWYPEGGIMSRIAVCSNCKRETSIVAKGLCGVCYTAVHGKFDEGSDPYIEALLKAKERCAGLVVAPVKKGRPKKEAVIDSSSITNYSDKSFTSGSNNVTEQAKANLISLLKTKRDQINQAIEVIEAL